MGYINADWVKAICRPGEDEKTCRYLTLSDKEWECEKLGELKKYIDDKVAKNEMIAKGDNCAGR